MKVRDTITQQQLTVDEAYERFFDGFYNLGKPEESFQGTMVLGPRKYPLSPLLRPPPRARRSKGTRPAAKRSAGRN